jgi:DNA-binding response OmpR family regulator
VLTAAPEPLGVLPALGLLGHTVRSAPPEVQALLSAAPADVVVVDARTDLAAARALCRLLRATGGGEALVAVVSEAGFAAVSAEWGLDEVVTQAAGPAEVEARLRLARGRGAAPAERGSGGAGELRIGDLAIDERSYTVRLTGRPLDLTFTEFELLRHLARHPGRVYTRAQLLDEVWGYDYYGGTRTVDVHVRRLRAKLGPEHEALIGTVRNVGYRFTPPPAGVRAEPAGARGASCGERGRNSGARGTPGRDPARRASRSGLRR